jgi:hypothetical protein
MKVDHVRAQVSQGANQPERGNHRYAPHRLQHSKIGQERAKALPDTSGPAAKSNDRGADRGIRQTLDQRRDETLQATAMEIEDDVGDPDFARYLGLLSGVIDGYR